MPYMWCHNCGQKKHISTQAFNKYKYDGFKLKCPICGSTLYPITNKKRSIETNDENQSNLLQFDSGGE